MTYLIISGVLGAAMFFTSLHRQLSFEGEVNDWINERAAVMVLALIEAVVVFLLWPIILTLLIIFEVLLWHEGKKDKREMSNMQ